jgi:threonine aldolase
VLTVQGADGKIDPASVDHMVGKRSDIHYPKPRVVSVTQATELGTVYRPEELAAIGARARAHGLRFHMDGARFANAVASLGVAPKELTWKVGVDVLCFGGTKNGMAVGEAVVFFDRALAAEFDYRCKQAGQLASKMRFLAAPWVGTLAAARGCDTRDARTRSPPARGGAARDPGRPDPPPRQANAVFAALPPGCRRARARGWRFYDFIGGGSRFMCAWDSTEDDVRALADDLASFDFAPPSAALRSG